ncbi:neural-cadherin-like isoform X2 [Mytilus edulis]|uniref:neural-cadherin-like isoform X2 n=1 Tax=Mytilus edulis TaxID=6550 RepID=UPI0039EF8251
MSKMAAPSSLWCLGSYLILLALDLVMCDRVSKLHVPHLTPPDSVIITISSLAGIPSLVNQQELSGIFDLSDTEFKSKGDLSGFLGGTFDIIIKSDVHTSEQHHLLVKVDNSSKLFSFSHHQYFASVLENSARHTKLDVIGDLFVNCDTDVSLRFVSGMGDKFYVKRHKNGAKQGVEIYTNGPLDREKKDSYSLLLQAKSLDGKIAQTVIHVYIQDENDEIPEFNQTKYTTNIPAGLSVGSSILKVHAIDKDIGTISYHLEGTTDFSINPISGDIILSSNSYSVNDHKFRVVATDQGGLKSSANIQINILPGNLKFIPHHHLSKRSVNRLERSFENFENEGKSKPLFSISSQPTPSTGIEQYHLIESTVDMFQVDTRGNIFVKEGHTLNYEEASHRSIIMQFNITNTNSQTDYTLLKVTLTVKDVNDEKPRFINEPRPFLATVSTNPSIGELVYELMADDADTGSSITYILESAGEGKFAIQNIIAAGRHIGRIVTTKTGHGQYEKGREFSLVVSAQDTSVPPTVIQKSNFEIVKVLVGSRPPQFFEDPYIGYVMENNQAGYKLTNDDGSPLSIKAKPFQSKTPDENTDYDGTIKFSLLDDRGQTSTLFTMSDEGEVATLQSMDYEASTAHQFVLTLRAVEESTGLLSTTQLKVNLIDVNDNDPTFELSTYTNTTSEGTPVNTTLFSVAATDRDSGDNAKLTYSVSDDHFYVVTRMDQRGRYIGDIKVAKRLDYDFRPDRLYKFNVTATDAGPFKKSGLANVVIYVTNINDEPPEFGKTKEDIHTFIREDQNAGSYVKTVQAIDPDGDNVEYYFTDKLSVAPNGPFRIDARSGLITLTNIIPAHIPSYTLNITAYDDGSCCGGSPTLRSDSYVVVEIKDINNNNPRFPSCSYAPHIMENMAPGTFVVRVQAEDDDRGFNGKIKYHVVTPAGKTQSFNVDPDNGTVTSRVMFDRESEQGMRGYPLTIMAEDQGQTRKLNSLCTFWVTIDDLNDNPPKFDSSIYTPTIVRSLDVNKVVTSLLATDQDMGTNAEVTYSLIENPEDRFRIDSDTGTIFLSKSLSDFFDSSIRLQVRTEDKGIPPLHSTVLVNIDVTTGDQPAPTWDDNYNGQSFTVNETEQVGYKIATFYASSNVPPPLDGVSFAIVDSNGQPRQSAGNFRVEGRDNYMNLRLNGPLNYKINNTYTLRLRVTNQGLTPLSQEMRVTINVRDMNNEVPQFEGLDPKLANLFRGSVPENEPSGVSVFTVKAVDADADLPNNLVYYSLVADKNNAYLKFRIDQQTGLITTNTTFDREEENVYFITVMAKDGINSDIPYHEPPNSPNSAQAQVQVIIGDKNDNPPVFEKPLYETNVFEQPPDSSKSIIRVQATDKDIADTLTYSITSGNTDGVFSIRGKSGDIYVARDLDYETMSHTFTLTITVSDSFYTNMTTAILHVQDVNDNAPEFTKSEYVITSVVEEETPPRGGQFLVQVGATDKDTARTTDFVYSISSDDNKPNDPTFSIEPKTGRIFLLKSLDRDLPKGRAEYQFNVLVVDEPNSAQSLIGYAYVKVKPIDINDNRPEFTTNLTGYVPENSAKGKNVMTVRANDVDYGRNGTVHYMIGDNRPVDPETSMSLFLIDRETGLITSNTNKLDRETLDRYYLPIVAYDNGVNPQSSTATVTVVVTDENDERPKFLQKIYRVDLSESQLSGPVVSVVATDDDVDDNAKLTYSIVTQNDLNFFSIITLPSNDGVITVYNPVDYENRSQRFFNLTVKARDANPNHFDIAHVEITVTDANDEKPEFLKKVEVITKDENIPENSLLHTFSAHDKDSPPNNEFTFSIADHADRFYVEQHGDYCMVKIQNGLDGQTLDRETSDQYTVKVLAIDKGIPAQTGTATLYIKVTDLNDEAPTFAKQYRPIVMEDEDPSHEPVITFSAMDRDTKKYGPPFKFELPPCKNPTCNENINRMFSLEFDPTGDGGNGTGKVMALGKFFREEQKFYYLPIIMKDMGGNNRLSMTGTSTLTIEIGDKNNNQHYDGFKEIFVYNYKGLFGDIEIGRANAEDLDDWDHKDKLYVFKGPKAMAQFFSVNEETGMITMKKGVPGGVFDFKVTVYDHVVFNKKNATASIKVTVKEISDNAVYSSGSIRLTGITAEQFMEKPSYMDSAGKTQHSESNYEKFQKKLAEKLGVPVENVDIFSVMDNKTMQYLDIRYAAHGSPWYPPSKIDGIVTQYKTEFETESGGNVAMVNIDECLKEICDSGGCSNVLYVDEHAPVMINTKGKSFVGIGTKIVAECQCLAKNFSKPLSCTAGYCFNGGTCFKDDFGDLSCSCHSEFNGKRCQQTHHSFNSGYTVYQPLAQCEDSTTSIEFVTKEKNGLLFYNGPVDKISPDHPKDFISLELRDGYPVLYINHGTGTLKLQLDGKGKDGITRMKGLDDGTWRRIDLIRNGQHVTMIVDHCASATSGSTPSQDRKSCEISGKTLGRNKYLNVNTVLQMGGRYSVPAFPTGITNHRFNGCIRNFYHNGELYDLHTSKNHPGENHQNGCQREDAICGRASINSVSKCGQHGTCEMVNWYDNDVQCVCNPGYRPADKNSIRCQLATTVRDFNTSAFMVWDLKDQFLTSRHPQKLSLQLRFRTRDFDGGVLLHLPSTGNEFITLEIVNNHVQGRYNLGSHDSSVSNVIALSEAVANNGQWHTVTLTRSGQWIQLKMDSGEGRFFNETFDNTYNGKSFMLSRDRIVSGSRVVWDPNARFEARGLSDTCVTDIRVDNKWFPMKMEESTESPAAVMTISSNVRMGCYRPDCNGVVCQAGKPIRKECYPLWGTYECRCPNHSTPISSVACDKILYCKAKNPCYSGGKCIELPFPKTFRCKCPPGWTGELCNQQAIAEVAQGGVTTELLVIIFVSIFAVSLIALIAFLLITRCNKREGDKSILYDDQYDDIRENVIDHDEQGAGEEDKDIYDVSRLRRADMPYMDKGYMLLPNGKGPYGEGVEHFIHDRLDKADEDGPPHDNVMEFAYEGGDTDVGSLSSLNTSTDGDQDYNYLEDWGPKFSKLANMYGGGEGEEDL